MAKGCMAIASHRLLHRVDKVIAVTHNGSTMDERILDITWTYPGKLHLGTRPEAWGAEDEAGSRSM